MDCGGWWSDGAQWSEHQSLEQGTLTLILTFLSPIPSTSNEDREKTTHHYIPALLHPIMNYTL